jgi:hypothetical protein
MGLPHSLLLVFLVCGVAFGYPLDGGARTGIRRLEGYRKLNLPKGALWSTDQIRLRLQSLPNFDITPETPRDPYLQKGIEAIFAGRDSSYSIAILDITDPAHPRYAALREDVKRIPGSVGKILVATGMFGAVARAYPDPAARERFLRETVVTADDFVHVDGKTVPFYDAAAKRTVNRRIEIGDRFNLYEWLDHMLSQSSNAAASFTWKQTMLLYRFGSRYPLPDAEATAFFRNIPKTELGQLSLEAIESALRASGINTDKFRIGTLFTRNGSRVVPGTASYACPSEMLRWLVKLEQGKIVDAWSSLDLKRLLYFARPRYRYASSPAIADAGVYFKSGSLFQCAPEPGYQCVQYKGNKMNLMHSVAIVESGSKAYLVAMTSNVLKLNSAVEHQSIATMIERLIQGKS